jgi:molybdopterin converting factor small subunit
MPKVKIPTPLRQYTGGNAEVEVGGQTAGDALGNLTGEYPQLQQHLYTGDGKLRDELSIIPSIAGGNTNSSDAARCR